MTVVIVAAAVATIVTIRRRRSVSWCIGSQREDPDVEHVSHDASLGLEASPATPQSEASGHPESPKLAGAFRLSPSFVTLRPLLGFEEN